MKGWFVGEIKFDGEQVWVFEGENDTRRGEGKN